MVTAYYSLMPFSSFGGPFKRTLGRRSVTEKDILDVSSRTLETVCKLDIGGTLPELQHQFCGLWNKLVDTAQTDQSPSPRSVLHDDTQEYSQAVHRFACKTLIHLRQTFYTTTNDWDPVLDDPMSYPMCTIDGHCPSAGPGLGIRRAGP